MYQITNDPNLKLHYKNYTNILRKVIHESKLKCNTEFIKKAENKGKAIWEVVKRETGKKSCETNNEIEMCSNGQVIHNPLEIAEMFNTYFANVTKNSEIPSTHSAQPIMELPETVNTIFLTPVTPDEVLKIINKLKNSMSCGVDGIPDAILKECASFIITPLLDICNSSLIEGKFPDNLKIAKIRPTFKKGKKHNMENYRPISLSYPFFFLKYLKKSCIID